MKVAILGATGGIGAALVNLLATNKAVDSVFATFFSTSINSKLLPAATIDTTVEVHWSRVDATDEQNIEQWLTDVGQLDWIINCVGMLHERHRGPEKSIRSFQSDHFSQSMMVNCLPTLLLAKYAAQALKSSDRGVFATVSARVGSIQDNRLGGWYSYRASKAALNMVLKTLSIEWNRTLRNTRVLALHPGTTDSKLSEPFQKNLPEGQVFTPEKTAGLLLRQIESAHQYPSGRFIAYGGEEIPW